MIATVNESDRFEGQLDNASETDRFEHFTYRRRGEFPVRSHAARTRAKMRSRGTSASRIKARTFNGANRRGRGKKWAAPS